MAKPEKVLVIHLKSHGGRDVPNQYVITTGAGQYFQSHKKLIAFIPNDESPIVIDRTGWNVSKTTAKYRNKFLGETTAETERKIREGIYQLADLNA